MVFPTVIFNIIPLSNQVIGYFENKLESFSKNHCICLSFDELGRYMIICLRVCALILLEGCR